MKILSIANRYYLISLLSFFVLAGVLLFYAISYNLDVEIDEQLRSEQMHFAKKTQSLDVLNAPSMQLFNNLIVKQAPSEVRLEPEIFDSMMYDDLENEMIPFRVIRFTAKIKDANYLIVMRESKIESDDLLISIFFSLMLVFGLFCVILYVSNSYLNKKIWSPFLETISAIKALNIHDREVSFKYQTTYMEELNELNSSLDKMVERIKSDYFRMKEFSENAAHELQTPLSIIRSKLEILLQSKELNDENAQLINQALESTVRLSRLNQSLLLLTKIENHQFEQKQKVYFSTEFDKYMDFYDEMIESKAIDIQFDKNEEFVFEMNPVLADILISNLLSNAIKHNVQSGDIVIRVMQDGFEITNTGEAPEYPVESLFSRFKKGNHSPEHLGLGLALVKEIIETSDLKISYLFKNGRHEIIVKRQSETHNCF